MVVFIRRKEEVMHVTRGVKTPGGGTSESSEIPHLSLLDLESGEIAYSCSSRSLGKGLLWLHVHKHLKSLRLVDTCCKRKGHSEKWAGTGKSDSAGGIKVFTKLFAKLMGFID